MNFEKATAGFEVTGLGIFHRTRDDTNPARVEDLIAEMNADEPPGGTDFVYGTGEANKVRFWEAQTDDLSSPYKPPLIVFVHGGGDYLGFLGSAKVKHLTSLGYAFASVNYTLIPEVTVERQAQEVANCLFHLINLSTMHDLNFQPDAIVLMGHSSGAHLVTLLGTDMRYLDRADVDRQSIQGVISLDGSNYNAEAYLFDNPGTFSNDTFPALNYDSERLQQASPLYHAAWPNAGAFLLLHVQRNGDIRQAVEFRAALAAAETDVELRVFEGEGFEGHMQMLLRLGREDYPATRAMNEWLAKYCPV